VPASEENDESFGEVARDEGLIEEGGSYGADPQSAFPRALLRDGVSFPKAIPENPADTPSTSSAMSGEHREHTSFVIPGVSTYRTEFAAFAHTADTTQVTQQEESQESRPDKAAPLHAPALLPHTPEATKFESELLSRLEHLVTESAKVQHSPETLRTSVLALSPNPAAQMGVPNRERGDTDVARRLTHLQRTVSELAATVAAQAARMRDEYQAQGRERQPPPQRTVVIQRGDASSTTPRAFWERSRLGRLHLRTGR
jgi:hypothetical protein